MSNQDLQTALDANSFTRFTAAFPETAAKRANITIADAEMVAAEETFQEGFAEQLKIAEGILAVGVEDFNDFVRKYRAVNGKAPLIGYLREIYDEFYDAYHADHEEARATGN